MTLARVFQFVQPIMQFRAVRATQDVSLQSENRYATLFFDIVFHEDLPEFSADDP